MDEVFRRVREAYQLMDFASGRSTLRLFSDSGVVTEAKVGGRHHREPAMRDGRHHRMVCRIRNGASNLSPGTRRSSLTPWCWNWDLHPTKNTSQWLESTPVA